MRDGEAIKLADKFLEGDTTATAIMSHVLAYMEGLCLRYAFLTCHNFTWLGRRDASSPNVLRISEAIDCSHDASADPSRPTLMLALLWLLNKAVTAPEGDHVLLMEKAGPTAASSAGGSNPRGSAAGDDSSKSSQKRNHSSSDEPPKPTKRGVCNTGSVSNTANSPCSDPVSSSTRQQHGNNSTAATAAAVQGWELCLPLADICSDLGVTELHSISYHSISLVVKGSILGRAAMLKLLNGHNVELVQHEAYIYNMLQPLQGVYVPAVLGIGRTCGGLACFIATSLVQGTPLEDLAEQSLLTPEVCVAAVEALQAVHSRRVLQTDMRLDHMFLMDGDSSQQQGHQEQLPGSSADKGALAGSSAPKSSSISASNSAAYQGATHQNEKTTTHMYNTRSRSKRNSSHVRPQVMLLDFGNAVVCTCKAEMDEEMDALQRQLQANCTGYQPMV
eukprot:jgi/Chrzof1/5284/Cz15g20200.t1